MIFEGKCLCSLVHVGTPLGVSFRHVKPPWNYGGVFAPGMITVLLVLPMEVPFGKDPFPFVGAVVIIDAN